MKVQHPVWLERVGCGERWWWEVVVGGGVVGEGELWGEVVGSWCGSICSFLETSMSILF